MPTRALCLLLLLPALSLANAPAFADRPAPPPRSLVVPDGSYARVAPGAEAADAAVADGAAKRGRKKLRRLDVRASDLAFNEATGELYVTVGSQSPRYPNSLLVVKPKTLKVVRAIPLTGDPRALALSADGRTAQVLLDAGVVARVDLVSRQIVSQFTATLPGVTDPTVAYGFAILPEAPGTVAISFGYRDNNGAGGTAIYDDGVMRPAYLRHFTTKQLILRSDVLWASQPLNSSSANVYRVRVGPSGLALQEGELAALAGHHLISVHDGLIYSDTGEIVNTATLNQVGWIPGNDSRFAHGHEIDRATNRIYYANSSEYFQQIFGYDLATERVVSYYDGGRFNQRGEIQRLVSCGPVGMAGLTDTYDLTGSVVFYPPTVFTDYEPYKRPTPVAMNGQVRVIDIPHEAVTYDSVRRTLYASVGGNVPGIGNSVVEVDPYAGSVGRAVWVGGLPARSAMSTDGRSLYVAMWGALAVARLALPDLTSAQTFPIYRDSVYDRPWQSNAQEILPLPGSSDSVAVLHCRSPWDREQPSDGIGVYDAGSRRPVTSGSSSPNANTVELSADGRTIYGLNNQDTGFDFLTFDVHANGVSRGSRTSLHEGTFFDQLHCADGTCYTDAGSVIDVATRTRVGRLPSGNMDPFVSFAVALDTERNRVYQVISGQHEIQIHAYEIGSLRRVATLSMPGNSAYAADLLVWDDGRQLAFSTGYEIYLIPVALLTEV